MQIQRIGYRVSGFGRLTNYALRLAYMVSEEAKRRVKILTFWQRHGLAATTEAFNVSRSSLFVWKRVQKVGNMQLEALNPKSTKPKNVRKRLWPKEILTEIRRLRDEHPNLGKEKVQLLLKPFCVVHELQCPSQATVGRLISDAPDKMRRRPQKVYHNGKIGLRNKQKVQRKPKQFRATIPGECVAFDTVETLVHGKKTYVVTAIDLYTRFAFAMQVSSHASSAAKDFFTAFTVAFPHPMKKVLTDNGSEFKKHFDSQLRDLHYDHWHTYPRTPKMNAHCERFNRTLQEEFLNYHIPDLMDSSVFNRKLLSYLTWYNVERPHWSLDLKTPIAVLWSKQTLEESSMWWADT